VRYYTRTLAGVSQPHTKPSSGLVCEMCHVCETIHLHAWAEATKTAQYANPCPNPCPKHVPNSQDVPHRRDMLCSTLAGDLHRKILSLTACLVCDIFHINCCIPLSPRSRHNPHWREIVLKTSPETSPHCVRSNPQPNSQRILQHIPHW
jgi:hypothetical protein